MARRLALFLGLAALAGPVSAQAPARPGAEAVQPIPGDATRGAATYRSRCQLCHRDARALASRTIGRAGAERLDGLDGFLATHHLPDPGQRRDVVAYLRGLLNS